MDLLSIAKTSTLVAGTRSRLQKQRLLAAELRRCGPDDVATAVCLLMGILPQGKIGLGYATVQKVRVEPARQASLSLADIAASFRRIAATKGAGAQAQRERLLAELLAQTSAEEQHFLIRLLLGELRQGALEGVMNGAIAQAFGQEEGTVRRGVMLTGDPAMVARAALMEGRAGLERLGLELFRPVQPMLAQPAEQARDVFVRLERAALEYKLDGVRVQIHKRDDEIRVYTRHLNEVTGSVPELVERVAGLPATDLILDGEAIALDDAQRPLPFQVTMQRFGRRLKVAQMRELMPLSAYFFDFLHLDGTDLLERPTRERVGLLHDTLPDELLVPGLIAADETQVEVFMRQSLAAGHEGIMAKSLDAVYQAGSRGADWFKLKPAHTLDLVVLAAEWGSGRRQGKLSNLHLGARDPEGNDFVMLGKTFKGLTDAMLAWQTQALLTREIGRDGQTVYVRPELVVEVAFNELQRSKQYPAGLALRFARVKRYRQDKTALQADTLNTVRQIAETGFRGAAA
jgi:DNA ligase-1